MANRDTTASSGKKPSPVARSSNGTPLFECLCPDCGIVRIQDRRKIGKPCRPCAIKRRKTHGLSGTEIYNRFLGIKARCTIPSASNYAYYGARGIKICDQWLSDPSAFVKWAVDNGFRSDLEVDRIDVNGPYAPWNCRLISHKENSRNRRNAQCNAQTAARAKALLSEGHSIKSTATELRLPYMVVWHISKGNSWADCGESHDK